jgi:conjugative relaxase-like TrwC/TraI family protein
MLRITTGTSAARVLEYFLESLLQEKLKGLDHTVEPGQWLGKLATRLGLIGPTTREAFASLLGNMHPATGDSLTPRTKDARRPGYEANFSGPKSLTIMCELTRDPRLYRVFVDAVRETMVLAEQQAATRVRRDGADTNRRTGELVWAEFIHHTARPVDGVSDPQLHAHCFIMNATWDDAEKRIKAVQLGDVCWEAPLLEAHFSSILAEKVQALGYSITVKGRFWEVDGVPDSVIRKFSRRTEQIDRVAEERGITDPEEKARLGAKTRNSKDPEVRLSDLRAYWASRLTPRELAAVHAVRDRAEEKRAAPERERPRSAIRSDPDLERSERREKPLSDEDRAKVAEAVRSKAGALFERTAVAPERDVLDVGLRAAPGRARLQHVREEMAAQGVITRVINGRTMVTTEEAVKDERRLVELAVTGKGRYVTTAATSPGLYPRLTTEQAEAVAVVLESPDLVTIVQGRSGVGKTRLTQVAVREIWQRLNMPVCILAPTALAARGVLREEGHKHADTVAKFLVDESLQARARHGVIWVDEAGLLGVKDAIKILDKATALGARVVLMGDDKQHRSVARGSLLETLQRHAGVRTATVDGVMRQKGAYKAVVEAMNRGDVVGAVKGLDAMRAIQVVDRDRLFETAAADYVETRARGDSVVLVTPTHAEGQAVTEQVRRLLRERGELRGGGKYESLVSRNLTEFERGEAKSYRAGDVVQFHRTVSSPGRGTFESRSRWTVLGHDPFGNVMVTRGGLSVPQALPLKRADSWDVFGKRPIELAVGDTVRITNGGRLHSRLDAALKFVMPSKQDPTNPVSRGEIHTVKKISPGGRLTLDNGLVVPKDFGHITHGYYTTSYGVQGMSIDRVIGVQTQAAGAAASQRQFYVTTTRGKKSVRVYTDNREAMLESVLTPESEASALGLLEKGVDPKEYAARRLGAQIHQRTMAEQARQAEELRAEQTRRRAMGA